MKNQDNDISTPFNIGCYARTLGLPRDAVPSGFSNEYSEWLNGWDWQDKQEGTRPVCWSRTFTEYPDSFADQPVSILEARANRTRGGADVWTVRDALLAALRDHDSGADVPEGFMLDQVVIIMVATGPDNDTAFRYYQRVKSRLEHLGILDTARFDSNRGCLEG